MIPDGYKKWPHEGLLPETWKVLFASEVCSKITDGTHDTPSPTATGIPYITAVHVKGGFINFKDCKYLPQDVHNGIYKRCNSEKGDLLVVNIGAGVLDCGYVNVDFEFSLKNVALLKPNETKITSEFLFQHHQVRKTKIAHQVKAGGAQPFLSLKELKRLRFVIPPLPEQKKIAEILSTWDKAIATVEKLIANSQQKKKALMQQLLIGKKRFPEFDGEWKEVRLEMVAKIIMGSSPSSKAYNDKSVGLPLIQGNADIKKRKSAPRIFTTEITKECDVGDILLSVRAPVGEVSISIHHACIGRGIASIKSNNPQQHDFLYQWLLWHEPRWASLSQGSTFSAVNGNDIRSMLLLLPSSIKEQQKIASVLSSADQEIETWQQELENLKQEKKALMQQLLTGKRRVKVIISATETLQLGGSHEV